MKKTIIITLLSFSLLACKNNQISLQKDNYLLLKEELEGQSEFTTIEDMNFDLNISIDRITEQEISYRAIIDNPKENMYNIKALVIHNHDTKEIYPSIGIFDESIDLIVENEEIKGINLVGYIETKKDLKDLDVRVYIEYTNEENKIVKIYYKTTN